MSSGGRQQSGEKASIWSLLNPDENRPRRTIRASEYIAVRKSLPPSALTRVILNINVCIDRQLDIEKQGIGRRQSKYNACFEHSKRAFLEDQAKKSSLWRSRDELKMTGMNLPTLDDQTDRPPGMQVVYTNPRYLPGAELEGESGGGGGGGGGGGHDETKLKPYERLRRSRTEILRHKHDFYTSNVPPVTVVDERELHRFNTFCAGEFVRNSLNDNRFRSLDASLERNKSGSPTGFVRWLAKRFPDGSSKDNTNYEYKYRHRRRTGLLFPSLVGKSAPQAAAGDGPKPLSARHGKPFAARSGLSDSGKRTACGTEAIGHTLGSPDTKTAATRQFNSPSHKHRFEVKSGVIRS